MRIDLKADLYAPEALRMVQTQVLFFLPFCDGSPVFRAIALDTDQGWVERLDVDEKGNFMIPSGSDFPSVTRLTGKVELFPVFPFEALQAFVSAPIYSIHARLDAAMLRPLESRDPGDEHLLSIEIPELKTLPPGPITEEYLDWLYRHLIVVPNPAFETDNLLFKNKTSKKYIQWIAQA